LSEVQQHHIARDNSLDGIRNFGPSRMMVASVVIDLARSDRSSAFDSEQINTKMVVVTPQITPAFTLSELPWLHPPPTIYTVVG